MSRTLAPESRPEAVEGPAGRPPETTRPPAAEPRCVHRWIEARAARAPEAVALTCAGASLTYGELNARANRLARRLRDRGVGPEVLVGLCTSRSPEMVAALLAILKAGGAYVPLDPAYPPDRLAFLLQDASVPVLLTQSDLLGQLPATSAEVVVLDLDREGIEEAHDGDLPGGAGLDNLAYVIYTSGSTGRPKGVMIHHRGLANYLAWCTRAYNVAHGEGSPVHSSIAFDLTVTALWAPLVAGRRVDLLDEDLGIEQLSEALRWSRDYSLVKITPAHLRALGDQLGPEDAPGRTRAFIIGGEQLTAEHVAFWRAHAPETALINEYGPTETVVGCCVYRVPRDHASSGPIPIGRPIANMRLYVLDRHLQPVAMGVTGELYIGGPGVARGYLRRPGLTAERFIPDPFGVEPGGRLYQTGDLARWRSDGNLEYLGRVDRQVKIRGFRIEPAEIEEALLRHEAVREAVVVAREESPDDRRLVAYLTIGSGQTAPADAELRRFLRDLVPEPMIPSAFVVLESLPLSPNGKVDPAALPAPGADRPGADAGWVAPRGPIEEAVAAVFGAVLGRERIGAHENFFDLGGHSLLATQVISRLRDALDVEIPLGALFEAATVAELAGWIEAARPDGDQRAGTAIEPTPRVGPLPLSFTQEALWFLDQLAPAQPTFNVYAAVRITGPLDPGALERGLSAMVRRHESLRTTFVASDGTPQQVIAPDLPLSLQTADLTGLQPADREAQARRQAIDQARRPFDLAQGPLARVSLLRLGESQHVALLTMHHLITDGWSFGLAATELAALYAADRQGLPSPLADLPIQYADFARWQREQLAAGGWATSIESWKRRLSGVPPLELPAARPRPPIRSSRGALLPLTLPPELSESVRAFSRREGLTPFMTLLAAFEIVLGRWSGQDDFAVGSPMANRTRPETQGLIGYFVNMVALRADLAGNPTVHEFLCRVRDVSVEAMDHQEIPLEVLIPALRLPRDASRSPLFQVMFVLQNNPMPALGLLDLAFSPLDLDEGTGTAKFELSLGFDDTPAGFAGSVEFNTDLFEAATIERFSHQYVKVLEYLIAHPERRLSGLSLLTVAEREQVVAWSRATPGGSERGDAPGWPEPSAIHGAFEAQVRATPDGTALISGEGRLTYAELNARANQLAHHLRARGVGPEVRVGLVLDDPMDRIAAVLGVLKAGGAYVPLEPSLPPARLEMMLDAACASILIVDPEAIDRAPRTGATTIELDADWANVVAQGPEDPSVLVEGENLAYVVFTSGTTGRPKGVMVSHRSLLAAAAAWEDAYDLRRPPLRHLQVAGFGFDVFAGDWIRALTTGGTLVMCRREVILDPAALVEVMGRERIECVELVPALAELLVAHLEQTGGDLASLRLLAVGSDILRADLYRRLRRLMAPQGRVVNSYGLTEATIDSTYFEGPVGVSRGDDAVPIGRPLPGTRAYVLDQRGEPVPVGVVGELYIGGSGVARGYAADPRQTAERFVPDPQGQPGSRMYQTGDRARWREGGILELLGRRDGQVKIRGFRVEVAEVEAALRRHPGVGEAVVVARKDTTGSPRLVAYVVPHTVDELEVAELRRWLPTELPEYMVPSAFVILEALPLSSHGKIDRAALPAPGPGRLDPVVEYVAPRNPLEETLVQVWAEVLEFERIGVHDNFFDLGGHSLQAVKLVARLTTALNRPVSVKTVFLAPTVAAMADVLEREAAAADSGERSHTNGDATAELARWLLESEPAALPEHVTIERRPFLPLFKAGELAPVDSVALGYLPSALLPVAGLDRATVIHDWCGDRPIITDVRETPLGRIASAVIPRFDDQLYEDRRDLLAVLGDAVRLAHEIGAATVSLTGLLPSASDYGRDLAEALAGHDLPRITTGHATTTSAVVLAVRRALEEGGRDLGGEHAGFLGLGSVGIATLRLLLSCLPHPARLTLCDVYSKQESLETLQRELREELGYAGEVRLLASRHEIPAEFYEASLIVGATNVPDILDVDRVAPGTIVVDDSAPHAFPTEAALRRFHERGDILVTEGGVLLAPEPLPLKVYVPDELEPWLKAGLAWLVARSNPWSITGCVLSGLLSAKFAHLAPTLGLIDRRTALDHYETLDALGFESAGLELDDTPLDQGIIREFRSRYGNAPPPGRAPGNGRDRSGSHL
jgi:amino acid adenylation domain-containing protein